MNNKRKVLLIYTGGTIGMVYDKKLKTLVPINFDQLNTYISYLDRMPIDIAHVSFETPIDSSNILPRHWIELAEIIEKIIIYLMALLSCMVQILWHTLPLLSVFY